MNESLVSAATESGRGMEWNSTAIVYGTVGSPTFELRPPPQSTSDGYDHLPQSSGRFTVDETLLRLKSFDWNSSTEAVPYQNETESQLQSLEERIGSVCLGTLLFGLCLITFIGNAMVLHAVRMEPRLQTVSFSLSTFYYIYMAPLLASQMRRRDVSVQNDNIMY